MRHCVQKRCLPCEVVPSVGCSSMYHGDYDCDVDGAAPGDHRGVGDCRNHGMIPDWFFRCFVVVETVLTLDVVNVA